MSLKALRLRAAKQRHSLREPRVLPADPVEFCRSWLGYEPYPCSHAFLRDRSRFTALVQARQTGKTFNGSAKLLWFALRHPASLSIVTAPKLDQARNVALKTLSDHLHRLRVRDPALFSAVCGDEGIRRGAIRLRNGSVIRAEAPVPETIRGHTAKAVYLMEANFLRRDEELYAAVLFTLNTTRGYLVAESTPWSRDSVFYRMHTSPDYAGFSRHRVPYTEALTPNGPLNPEDVEVIRRQLGGDTSRWRREMLCEWPEDEDAWLPAELITGATDLDAAYWRVEDLHRGDIHAGLDLGKHRDPSALTVLERSGSALYLRLFHRFPLETDYSSIIGYVKHLQDRWRISRVAVDETGVGGYIVEEMQRSGVRVSGVTFTEQSKEEMAAALREAFTSREGDHPILHLPPDRDLETELNTERFTHAKTGRLQFTHPEGTRDDAFWALALAVHAAEARAAGIPLARI
jgi:phage FluMu gp28-like protein